MTTTIEAALIQAAVGLQPGMRAYGRNESSPDPGTAHGVTGIIVDVHPEDGIWIAPDGLSRKHHAYHFDVEHVVVHLDQQTCGALLRRLAMWAGDDGEAQAYWLGWSPIRKMWELYCSAPLTRGMIAAEFPSLAAPVHGIEWSTQEAEALAAILTHIGTEVTP